MTPFRIGFPVLSLFAIIAFAATPKGHAAESHSRTFAATFPEGCTVVLDYMRDTLIVNRPTDPTTGLPRPDYSTCPISGTLRFYHKEYPLKEEQMRRPGNSWANYTHRECRDELGVMRPVRLLKKSDGQFPQEDNRYQRILASLAICQTRINKNMAAAIRVRHVTRIPIEEAKNEKLPFIFHHYLGRFSIDPNVIQVSEELTDFFSDIYGSVRPLKPGE